MKEVIKVSLERGGSSSFGESIPAEVFDELVRKFPSGSLSGGYFDLELENDSPEFEELCAIIYSSAGLRPKFFRFPVGGYSKGGYFAIEGVRKYSRADFENSSYFCMQAKRRLTDSNSYTVAGEPLIVKEHLEGLEFGSGGQNELFCKGILKDRLESAAFAGLEFRETVALDHHRSSDDESVWQIWSSTVMPKMNGTFIDYHGKTIEDESIRVNGCCINDFFIPERIVYPPRALDEIKGIECVRSFEQVGSRPSKVERVPFIIVSKKFMDWCVDFGLEACWFPISLGK